MTRPAFPQQTPPPPPAVAATVTQLSPLHVQLGGRDLGPLRLTRAAATGVAVGDQVLLVSTGADVWIVVDKLT